MKNFLNSSKVVVKNGYLSVDGAEMSPIFHKGFVDAQLRAEYVVTFAKLAKGKDFVGKKADSLEDLKAKVLGELAKKDTSYVSAPKKVVRKITKGLADEAFAFMQFKEDTTKVEKINKFLQEFNIVNEFETVGLFFEQDIVKIEKIYTMKEIVAAVTETVNLLD